MKPISTGARLRSALFRSLRAGFRSLPLSESLRDVLRQRFLRTFPTIRPTKIPGQSVTVLERRARAHAASRAIGYVERRDEPLPHPLPATLVAFYLPQFHTIPENDAWWGKGFTEWRNVTRALPQFEGHLQPRLPGDLGFYDLRNPQVMRDQAELARAYGISAFCFYFYWFGGHTLLEDPLKQWLADPSIDLSFCLCWANENWTRRWDGRDSETLMAQSHSTEDDLAFIAHIAPYLRDRRYVRIDGKPLLLLYRPGLLPDATATANRWRAWCRHNDIGEITLAYVQSFERPDPASIGFDAAVEFPPNLSSPDDVTGSHLPLNPEYAGEILDWRSLVSARSNQSQMHYQLFPGVNPGWDNEPRRPGQGRNYLHASPRRYRDWLADTLARYSPDTAPAHQIVFINAWNEWAEGAVLEPDAHLGYAWLESTRRALVRATPTSAYRNQPCLVLHAWHLDVARDILHALREHVTDWRVIATTSPDRRVAVETFGRELGMAIDVRTFENRGRDILPFLHVADALLEEGHELVLKLHTKRSPHRNNGPEWCVRLLEEVASPSTISEVIRRFRSDPNLGLVAPRGHILPLQRFTGGNANGLHYLSRRTGVAMSPRAWFCSGSMFWIRLEALRPLLDAHLLISDFESEQGQTDGTLAHAVERFFGVSVEAAGFHALDTTFCAVKPLPQETMYPFAEG